MRKNIGYRHHFACLRIFGDQLDFDQITKQFKLKPDHTHKKGERRTPTSPRYLSDSWQTKAKLPTSRPHIHHIEWLYKHLKRNTSYLKKLSKTCSIDIYCSYHSNYDQGNLEFSPGLLQLCGQTKISIKISILVQ